MALLLVLAGGGLRLALYLRNVDLFSHPQVDELEYISPESNGFPRPPGTYLPAGMPYPRVLFGAISLLPSLFFLFLLPRGRKTTLLASLLAVEPTLALSGIQILPEAPAAALVALSLALSARGEHRLSGFSAGVSALFRGELLLLPLLFPLTGRKGLVKALYALAAVLPLMAANLHQAGSFSTAVTGGVNLWIGSDWNLLTTPPGVEFEQLMEVCPDRSFTGRAVETILKRPGEWALMGFRKTLAFFSLPGPGRNMDSGALIMGLFPLLGITLLFLAGVAGFRRNTVSVFMAAALLSAFIFFPSIRYRAVFMPAFALSVLSLPLRKLIPGMGAVILAGLLIPYPGHVRPGLNTVLTAQNALREERFGDCLALLDRAERLGYRGADLHNIRASAMAMEGRDFREVLLEFGKALEAAPRSPTVWRNMAVFLWNTGRIPMAREAAEHAVSLNPSMAEELRGILRE